MLFGLATAFILRAFHFGHTAQEVALIGMMAYLAYLMGDLLGLSGILALFVSAVAISHYALHNISAQSRTTTIYAFHTLSYISEGIIFVYCGLDALDPLKWRVRGRGGGERRGGMRWWGAGRHAPRLLPPRLPRVARRMPLHCPHQPAPHACRTPTCATCCGCSGS